MVKNVFFFVVAAAAISGCQTYAGVTTLGPDRVVVTRNDGLLFGLQRKIYICKVADAGFTDCVETREDQL